MEENLVLITLREFASKQNNLQLNKLVKLYEGYGSDVIPKVVIESIQELSKDEGS